MEIALILGLTMLVVWLAVGLAVAVIGVVGCLREGDMRPAEWPLIAVMVILTVVFWPAVLNWPR